MGLPESDCLSQLEAKLRTDSEAGTPPWASDAVAHAPQCGEAAVQWLLQRVAHAGGESFLALEALRIHFPSVWAAIPPQERAATYARQLATAHWFNAWGQPGEPASETAQALIGLGTAAIPYLTPLLDSQRPAPSFGSEEATLSRLLGYRVCDYAWAFIAQIEGEHPGFPATPEERDIAIGEMKQRLRRNDRPEMPG